jgi:hypothetical protein
VQGLLLILQCIDSELGLDSKPLQQHPFIINLYGDENGNELMKLRLWGFQKFNLCVLSVRGFGESLWN